MVLYLLLSGTCMSYPYYMLVLLGHTEDRRISKQGKIDPDVAKVFKIHYRYFLVLGQAYCSTFNVFDVWP